MSIRTIGLLAVLALALLGAGVTAGLALPPGALEAIGRTAGPGLLKQVRGCHQEPMEHFDDELGESAPHFHAGITCAAVYAGEDRPPIRAHCHRKADFHYHPEMNRASWHEHSSADCNSYLVEPVKGKLSGKCRNRGRTLVCG